MEKPDFLVIDFWLYVIYSQVKDLHKIKVLLPSEVYSCFGNYSLEGRGGHYNIPTAVDLYLAK